MRTDSPIRVLHVLGALDRGGAETWLLNVLRQIDRDKLSLDFLVHTPGAGAYERQVQALGSQVHRCLNPRKAQQYARNFKEILTQHGPYDVVHSHVHHFSGHILRAARQAGVPIRIAHSHSDTFALDQKSGFMRRAYLSLMTRWIHREATIGLAASEKAATALFGANWQADARWQVLFCGIDLAPFREQVDRDAVRDELGIPRDAFVVGHVGRFDRAKNQQFAVAVFREVASRDAGAKLLLIGAGDLRPVVEAQAAALGLASRVIFAGTRGDVPRLMLGAMDAFLFPSRYEGLPLVLVEAQAAGLPCVISDVIAEEAMAVRPLVQPLSLSQSPAMWAEAIHRTSRQTRSQARTSAFEILERSPLNIDLSAQRLGNVYLEAALRSSVAYAAALTT